MTIKFGRDQEKPIRTSLMAEHPRLLITPDRLKELIYRAVAIPDTLWQPRSFLTEDEIPPIAVSGTRGFVGHQLVSVATCYLATGQDQYLEEAVKIMRNLCSSPHWFNPGDPSDFDMAGSAALYGVAVAYDALYDYITPDHRNQIRDKLAIQADRIYCHWSSDAWLSYSHAQVLGTPWENNHCYVAIGALWCASVATYEEVPEAKDWYTFATDGLSKVVYITNAADGFAMEGLAYWAYARASNLVPFLDMFRNVTGIDLFDYYRFLEKHISFISFCQVVSMQLIWEIVLVHSHFTNTNRFTGRCARFY